MGVSAHGMGEVELARSNYLAAAELAERHYGPDHPDIALAIGNIAMLEADAGEHTSALQGYERAAAILEKTWGPESSEALDMQINVADALSSLERCDEALPRWDGLVERVQAGQGNSPTLARALAGQGACLDQTGEHERAVEVLTRAQALAAETEAPEVTRDSIERRLARARQRGNR
jgi:tetratricopeptide (TPR) repeat protein